MSNNSKFMLKAIELSIQSAKSKGGPFGCVIVKDNQIIAEGYNQVTSNNDPTAHAEILCIRKACKKLNQKRLDGLIMISYLEPCHMCKEVIKSSRLSEVYYLFKNANPSRKTISKVKYKLIKNNEENLIKKFFKNKRTKY